jgi:trigger factor
MTSLDADNPDMDAQEPEAQSGEAEAEAKPKLALEVAVDSPGVCQRHVTVTISREDIDRYYDEAFSEMMPSAAVPGFRKGRAPRKLVESRFHREVTDQIKGSLIVDTMEQIGEEHDLSAISEPDFDLDAVEVPDTGPMTFEFDLEVRPEFDLPQWKGLKLERPIREITQKEVDTELKRVLGRHSKMVPHGEPAAMEDYVVLNLVFSQDGRPISEAGEQTVQVRPRLSFPDGTLEDFGKLMVGAKAGDTRTSKVKLSHHAPQEGLRGQEVDVALEVVRVCRLELPELNDQTLSQLGRFDSEGDLRDAIRDELERQMEYHQNQRVRQQITDLLTESADWELPPALLRRQAHRELERAVLELRAAGFPDADIQARENELRQNSENATATALKEHFILERIAEEEEIEATPKDIDQECNLIAAQSDESPRSVRARIEKRGMTDALRNQIIERKVMELIAEHATYKEVEFRPPAKDVEAVDHVICGRPAVNVPEAKHGQAEELTPPVDRT